MNALTGNRSVLYSSVGEKLTRYEVDSQNAELVKRESVSLPANVQYVWPHPSGRYLYVASSPRGEPGAATDGHYLSGFNIDTQSGTLQPHGQARRLDHRPIHMTLDRTGRFALVAYNEPSSVTVHRLEDDGTIGAIVEQREPLETGIYAHQVLVAPTNRTVVLVTRGNNAKPGKAEDPGALKLFRFDNGALCNLQSVAPNGGYGFGPRHIAFHPTKPWVYVSLERQNALQVFEIDGDVLRPEPLFTVPSLHGSYAEGLRQIAGTVHIHPNGRFVYVANRADSTIDFEGRQVFREGENNIAVYAIDEATGRPHLIDHADPRAFHVRTFAFTPDARMMVAASIKPMLVRRESGVENVSAGLSIFRVGADGTLEYVRKYDVETGGKLQFWMGVVRF